MYKVSLVILVFYCYNTSGANILYISSVPSYSHQIWNQALASGLATKGHNLTYVAPNLVKNVTYFQILLEGTYDAISKNFDLNEVATHSAFKVTLEYIRFHTICCQIYAKSKGLHTLLGYPRDFFDLIILDVTLSSCLFSLIEKFGYPPTIGVTGFPLPPNVAKNFGNELYPAYVPWYGFPYSTNMGFFERFWNSLYTYLEVFVKNQKFGTKFFDHISLVLVNTDFILNYPQPLAPHITAIGGVHTKPAGLQNMLDDATNGVILFSLGTNIRSDKLDVNIQNAFLDAFSKIPETVIWKFEGEIQNLPQNVIVKKWLPQNDILGHPNVKLFIGHGGALSTQESIFHGVPMICIPFFLDQLVNAKNVVDKKLGLSFDFRNITSSGVLYNLREVLDNPVYSRNVKMFSQKFKDRAETPLERGLFWVEYVLRHGHAKFLKGTLQKASFFGSSELDVVGLLIALALTVIIIYKLAKI